MHGCLVMLILCALIEEPSRCTAFVKAMDRHDRSSFFAADLAAALLESMVLKTEADRHADDEEIRQLHCKSGERCTGLDSVGKVFGVITPFKGNDNNGGERARAQKRPNAKESQGCSPARARKQPRLKQQDSHESTCTPQTRGGKPKPRQQHDTQGKGSKLQGQILELGLTRKRYRPTGNHTTLQQLLDFCRAHDSKLLKLTVPDTSSFKRVVNIVKKLDDGLAKECAAWKRQPACVHHFLREKLVIHALVSTPLQERDVDWTEVLLDDIKGVCRDHRGLTIGCFPGGDPNDPTIGYGVNFRRYSAADMSQLCFRRVDLPIFVPLYAGIFRDLVENVSTTTTHTTEEVLEVVQSEAFKQGAQSHFKETGFAAHPSNLAMQLLSKGATVRVGE